VSVAPGDGAPPRARVQRLPLPAKLVRRWVGDAALPLYLQMSGYAYRRVSPAYKVWLFHWSRPFFLPLIFPATYLYLASYDWAQASNRPWIAPAFGALLFVVFFIPGCGIATPSLFPRWLANTARRGFLRDLSMSQLTAGEIVRAHALARIVPMAVFSFCLAELFLAMALVEDCAENQTRSSTWRSTPCASSSSRAA
jgi:hypothetical protein